MTRVVQLLLNFINEFMEEMSEYCHGNVKEDAQINWSSDWCQSWRHLCDRLFNLLLDNIDDVRHIALNGQATWPSST